MPGTPDRTHSLTFATSAMACCSLIHGPEGGPETRKQSWQGCILAKDLGLVRSVSNATPDRFFSLHY